MNIFQKVLTKIRHGILIQAIRDNLTRTGLVITPYYWVQEGLIDVPPENKIEDFDNYTFSVFEEEDIREIAKITSGDRMIPEKYTLDRLKMEHIKCFGVKYKGEMVAFSFINIKECNNQFHSLIMKKNEAYLFDMYTLKPYRGKNIAPILRYKVYEFLREINKDTFYSISEYFNKPSINFKKKLNAKFLELYLDIRFRNHHFNKSIKKINR